MNSSIWGDDDHPLTPPYSYNYNPWPTISINQLEEIGNDIDRDMEGNEQTHGVPKFR